MDYQRCLVFVLLWTCVDVPSSGIAARWKHDLSDYCHPSVENTPCFTKCVRSRRCGKEPLVYTSLTNEERELVVTTHNEFRSLIANGSVEKVPKSTYGIWAMSYDKEAEFLAACHAQSCRHDHDMVRLTITGEAMGQNIYVQAGAIDQRALLITGLRKWYEEVELLKDLRAYEMDHYYLRPDSAHVTQMIWGTTTLVGCAIMRYNDANGPQNILVCNYKPPGNIKDGVMYKAHGEFCNSTKKYPQLCGQIRPLSKDIYEPPINISTATINRSTFVVVITPLLVHWPSNKFN